MHKSEQQQEQFKFPNGGLVTYRYLEDFLCVIEHLDPYGDLAPRRLGWRVQTWLQGGHSKAFGRTQPLSSCGRLHS